MCCARAEYRQYAVQGYLVLQYWHPSYELTANVEILHLTIWLTLRYILVHFIIFLNDLPFSYQKGVPNANKYTLQETKIILLLFWTRQISKFSSNFTNISGKMLGQVFFSVNSGDRSKKPYRLLKLDGRSLSI